MKQAARIPVFALALILASGCIAAAQPAVSGIAGWDIRGGFSLFSTGVDMVPRHIDTPSSFTAVIYRTLIVLHVLGVTIGFGAALFLDAFLLRKLYGRAMDSSSLQLVRFGSRLVGLGLSLLWASGAGFLAYYFSVTPETLANPKIWAKVSVVVLLTVNGIYLHRSLFGLLETRIGRPLLKNASLREAFGFILPASLSLTGWTFAFVLGLVKELNNVVPVPVLLSAYGALLLGAVLAGMLCHVGASRFPDLGRVLRPQTSPAFLRS